VKRHLLIVAVLLLAGAVVNVAVAWGCAILVDASRGFSRDSWDWFEGDGWKVGIGGGAGARVVVLTREQTSGRTGLSPREILPRWCVSVATPTEDVAQSNSEERRAEGRGWPFLSMWSETQMLHGNQTQFMIVGGLRTDLPRPERFFTTGVILPLRPIWPGFAVNTIFYATLLWLPFVLRRLIRVRRGLCPACAYPRGESDVCSECGKALS